MRLAILATAVALLAVPAQAVVVDFSNNNGSALSAGDQITDFNFGEGVTGDVAATGGIAQAIVFDTNNPTGGDQDLLSPFQDVEGILPDTNFNNALIVQENAGNPIVPDDNGRGGTITFTFDQAVTLAFVDLLDIEEVSSISAVTAAGTTEVSGRVDNAGLPNNGPNQFRRFTLDLAGVTSFTVDFGGSGAIGQFEASVVPLPASLVLLLSAIAGLGFVTRRSAAA